MVLVTTRTGVAVQHEQRWPSKYPRFPHPHAQTHAQTPSRRPLLTLAKNSFRMASHSATNDATSSLVTLLNLSFTFVRLHEEGTQEGRRRKKEAQPDRQAEDGE